MSLGGLQWTSVYLTRRAYNKQYILERANCRFDSRERAFTRYISKNIIQDKRYLSQNTTRGNKLGKSVGEQQKKIQTLSESILTTKKWHTTEKDQELITRHHCSKIRKSIDELRAHPEELLST